MVSVRAFSTELAITIESQVLERIMTFFA